MTRDGCLITFQKKNTVNKTKTLNFWQPNYAYAETATGVSEIN